MRRERALRRSLHRRARYLLLFLASGGLLSLQSIALGQEAAVALLRRLGAPEPFVLWGAARNGPAIEALREQQRNAGAELVSCSRELTMPVPHLQSLPVFVAFSPRGTVSWTSLDREAQSNSPDPSSAFYRCVSTTLRNRLQVAPFSGDRPLIVLFPLRGSHW